MFLVLDALGKFASHGFGIHGFATHGFGIDGFVKGRKGDTTN